MNNEDMGITIYTYKDLTKKFNCSRSTLYREIVNERFPRPRRYFRGKLGWPSSIIDQFILNGPEVKILETPGSKRAREVKSNAERLASEFISAPLKGANKT